MSLWMSTAAPTTTPRSVLFDPDEQRVIEERRARRLQRLARRELWSFAVFAGGFLAAAFRLDFEIGTGSAVPTELILVPMLFVLPVGLVPLAVAAGIVLGSLDEHVRGQLRFARVPVRIV